MIELSNLTKIYEKNNVAAVDNLSLKVENGEFFGLLGPNGAGKTTTIEMLTTLLLPTKGNIYIDGEILSRDRNDIKSKFSLITQEFSLRMNMNLDEIMEFQARLYGISKSKMIKKRDELFELCGLTEHRKKITRHLSGGMKRKLMLARALLTEPSIIFLDEPTAGLDIIFRRQMWDLLKKLNNDGLTIILTTHYIEEAEALCDRVALMRKGKLVSLDSPKKLIFELGDYAVDVFDGTTTHSFYFRDKETALKFASQSEGKFSIRNTTLEDVFVKISDSGIELT